MVKDSEIEEMLKCGFEPKLIAAEFKISLEDVIRIKEFMDNKSAQNSIAKEFQEPKKMETKKKVVDSGIESKMAKMRAKYNELYLRTIKSPIDDKGEVSERDIKFVNSAIGKIEAKMKEFSMASDEDRKKLVRSIILEFTKIQGFKMNIEQVEKLNELIKPLRNRQFGKGNDSELDKVKRMMEKKLVDAVDMAKDKSDSVEELRALKMKLNSTISIGTAFGVRNKIDNKIAGILQNRTTSLRLNEDCLGIVRDLVDGKLDVDVARDIIDTETSKIVESKPKTRFTFTPEQEKDRIMNCIRDEIVNNADKYCILNPEETVLQFQELGGDLERALETVMNNLIAKKEFETARELCTKFSSQYRGTAAAQLIRSMSKRVRNAEIGDNILRAIRCEGNVEDDEMYINLIEKGLDEGNIKLDSISLGKNKEESRKITLADVWPDKMNRYR